MNTYIHNGITKVKTPFGAIEVKFFEKIFDKLGIKWNEKTESWTIISYDTGKQDKNKKDLWLSTRFNNIEIALMQAKQKNNPNVSPKTLRSQDPTEQDWTLALSYGYGKDYLPDLLAESSYSAIYARFGIE
jgi:hypothetical protein